ncbi:MAG: serine/threonine protein kinase [Calditrichae bacterium]|nr:serine/threonine protein kinase [Calditrichia bacterium]
MTKDRWDKIQTLFEQAVTIEPAERKTFLEQKCAGDSELLDELLSLLQADEDIPDILNGIAIDSLKLNENPDLEGKQIGAYRILKKIADGGMGSVYLAERSDGHFERRVALKVIKKGLDSEQVIRRFNRERQILARLHHPNIARLYDGGLTPDGRPYFTMEYISGLPINKYCDIHKLNTTLRLKLMLNVLETISYAHRNLIIHRDLKPGNIFVTDDGKIKLLDFGIARLLDEKDEESSQLTQAGHHILTPEYAAPEQLKSGMASISSDIYQLGVVLFELLKGNRPFDLTGKSINEIENIISNRLPEKLSDIDLQKISEMAHLRHQSVRDLKKLFKSDLEKITAKALNPEAGLRYLTVDAFFEDLTNFMDGKPVKATNATIIYRIKKYAKRHRMGLSVVSILLIFIIGLSSFYTIQLAFERDKAQAEAEKASQIASFMSGLFEIADPGQTRGEDISALELLDRGAKNLTSELTDQPEIKAALLYTIANVYINLGKYDRAEPLIKESLALRKNLFGINNEEVSETLSTLNKLYYELGKYDSSEVTIRQKIEISKSLHHGDHPDLALGYNDLAWILLEKGDYTAADSLNNLSLNMRKRLFGYESIDVAESINNQGSVQYAMSNLDSSLKLYRESLEIRKKLLGNDHPLVIQNYGNLGLVNEEKEQYAVADSFYSMALKMNIRLYGPESPQTAWSYQDISRSKGKQKKYGEALQAVRRANMIRKKTLGKDHILLAYTYDYQGDIFLLTENLDSAAIYYNKSIDIYRNADSSTWVYLASPLKGMGSILMKKGKYSEAEKYLREALTLREKYLPPDNYVIARARTALAKCIINLKNYNEAEELLQSAFSIYEKIPGEYNQSRIQTLETLVNLYALLRNKEKSLLYSNLIENLK